MAVYPYSAVMQEAATVQNHTHTQQPARERPLTIDRTPPHFAPTSVMVLLYTSVVVEPAGFGTMPELVRTDWTYMVPPASCTHIEQHSMTWNGTGNCQSTAQHSMGHTALQATSAPSPLCFTEQGLRNGMSFNVKSTPPCCCASNAIRWILCVKNADCGQVSHPACERLVLAYPVAAPRHPS